MLAEIAAGCLGGRGLAVTAGVQVLISHARLSPPPRYYALLGERFCKIKREYADCFAEAFVRQYQLIHRCGSF